MSAFLQTATGDIALSNGATTLVSGSTQKAQKLRNLFNLFLGSWFLDTRIGVPYFTKIFVKNPSIPAIKTLLRSVILSVDGLVAVPNIVASLNPQTRELDYSFTAIDDEGTPIDGSSDPPFIVGAS